MHYCTAEALRDTQYLRHCFTMLCGGERAFPVQPGENAFVTERRTTDNRMNKLMLLQSVSMIISLLLTNLHIFFMTFFNLTFTYLIFESWINES